MEIESQKQKVKREKKYRSKLSFRSIGTKLTLILVIMSITCISIIGSISYKDSSGSLEEQMLISSAQSLEYIDLSIDNLLEGLEKQINLLSTNPAMISYYEDMEATDKILESAISSIKELNNLDPNVVQTYFSTIDNRSIIYPVVDLSGYDALSRDWFKLGLKSGGESAWTNPYPDNTTGNMVVTLVKAVVVDGKEVGVVGMDVDLGTFSSDLASLNIGETGYLIMTDSQGVVLVDLDNERVGESLGDDNSLWKAMSANKDGTTQTEHNGINRYTVFRTNGRTGWKLAALIPQEELLQSTRPILYKTILVAVITIIAVIIITIFISKYITNIINKLKEGFNKAAGGDLTVTVNIKSKDEFGDLGSSFDQMISQIRELTKNVKASSVSVAETSESILQMTKETNSAMNEISGTIQEVAKGSQEQAADIDKNSQNVNELAKLLDSISGSTREISSHSEESRSLGNKGLEEVKILIEKSEETGQAAKDVNNIIFEVKKSAEEINAITEAINQIADQTNLLALNAAIEAARAGEAGRGFSVVADEIRKLAEQSSKATQEISSLIANMNLRTNEAVTAMGVAIDAVGEQVKSVDSTKTVFGEIITSIERLDKMVEVIKDSTHEMDNKKNQIVENTQNISAVSEEVSASTQEVSASSEEVTAITNTFMEHSESLRKISKDLIELVNVFTV